MYKNPSCIASLSSAAEPYAVSSKFLKAHLESAQFLQTWGSFEENPCLRRSPNDLISWSEASLVICDESPQRAKWIDEVHQYSLYGSSIGYGLYTAAAPHYGEYTNQRVFINSLPDELLCHIFRFLPVARDRSACASVSKRWLFLQSHMWQHEFVGAEAGHGSNESDGEIESKAVVSEGGRGIGDTHKRVERQPQWALGDLSRCFEGRKASDVRLAAAVVGAGARGGLGKVSIRQSLLTDVGLSTVGFCCGALKTLCLWDCANIEDAGLAAIGKGCGLLEKVDLFKCPRMGDLGLQSIVRHCPLLSFLSLNECGLVSDKAMVAVGESCANLLSLVIRSCPKIGDDGLEAAIRNLKKLKRMRLDGLRIGDKSLACIGLYAKSMVRLSLDNLDAVTEEGFVRFSMGQGMHSLVRFSVTSCVNFTDRALGMVGKMMPGMRQLSLVKCDIVSDMGLSFFMQHAASIQMLELEECHSITGQGLIPVFSSKFGRMKEVRVHHCQGVQDLDIALPLQSSHVSSVESLSISHCSGVDNMLLALVGCLCPHATRVDFSGLIGIGDDGVMAFLYSGNRQFSSVNLSGCTELTDRAVRAIAQQSGDSLRSLLLDGCQRITDLGLKSVADHCAVLEDLHISQCGGTDDGVSALLVENGLTLNSLNLSGCNGISDKILPLIEDSCHGLSDLNLKHCQRLSQKAINELESRLWKCAVISS